MGGAERPLTRQQQAVLDVVDHYHGALGEPVPAAYVARRLSISRQRVTEFFQHLSDLGWLRSAGSPAVPARRWLARDPLTKTQVHKRGRASHSRTVQPQAQPLPESRTIEFAPLSIRAAVLAQSIDEETRTVEVTFTTEAPVERYDWGTGERYLEVLSMDPKAVRIDRLNSIGPLLDSHSSYSVADVIGAVEPNSVRFVGKEGRARVRFSRRPAVDPIWQDVKDGILRTVSVGYRVFKYEEQKPSKANAMPIRRATDWEPYEISMVPIPADARAKVRGEKPTDTNPCEIVRRAEGAQETRQMNDDAAAPQSETIVQPNPLAPPPAPPAPAEPSAEERAASEERTRIQGIMIACRAARLPQSYSDQLIKDGTTLLEARGKVLEELAARGGDTRGPQPGPQRVEIGDDPLVHVRKGIENAVLHRVMPAGPDGKGGFALEEVGRPYRGMSLLRIAEAYLMARGVRTTHLSKRELAGMAMGLSERASGFHTSSDFSLLLADVANKTLRRAYDEAPQTFTLIGRRVSLPDFKPSNRLQIGDSPAMLEVKEHGEFQRGTMVEGKEVFQLKTYGRVFAITRQALINDDTDAFSRVATGFGRSARALESDLAWAQITGNPTMGDGVALFHATHGNLAGAGTAIDVNSLGVARAAIRVQKGLDGVTPLNINPRFLLVPAAKETLAAQFLTQITPALAGSVNPFAGILTPIVEPRLDVNSATAWYMVASPADGVDVLEYAYLEGEDGPMTEQRLGFDIDGLEIKARHDFAAKVVDWRGIYKNPGA